MGSLPVNSEVYIVGMQDHIGLGVLQGYYTTGIISADEEAGEPIVRFQFDNISKEGEKYLKSKKYLTVRAKKSGLYIVGREELTTVRHNGSRKNGKDT